MKTLIVAKKATIGKIESTDHCWCSMNYYDVVMYSGKRYEDLTERLNGASSGSENDVLSLITRIKTNIVSKWSASSQNLATIKIKQYPAHESAACRALMLKKLDEISIEVINQRITRNQHIQNALMQLLPRMAAFNREKFVQHNLRECLNYLLMSLRGREKDR